MRRGYSHTYCPSDWGQRLRQQSAIENRHPCGAGRLVSDRRASVAASIVAEGAACRITISHRMVPRYRSQFAIGCGILLPACLRRSNRERWSVLRPSLSVMYVTMPQALWTMSAAYQRGFSPSGLPRRPELPPLWPPRSGDRVPLPVLNSLPPRPSVLPV